MDVHRLVEDHAGGEVVAEKDRLRLGISSGEFATLAAGAGDEAAGDGVISVVKSSGLDRSDGGLEIFLGDARDDEVLPDGEADFSTTKLVGNVGESEHLCDGHPPYRGEDADVVLAVGLLMDAEVAVLGFRGRGLAEFQREITEGESHFLRRFLEDLRDAPVVDEIFEAGFFAIRAVSIFDEDAHQGGGGGDGLGGC